MRVSRLLSRAFTTLRTGRLAGTRTPPGRKILYRKIPYRASRLPPHLDTHVRDTHDVDGAAYTPQRTSGAVFVHVDARATPWTMGAFTRCFCCRWWGRDGLW
ncbi:hypothetical protein [Embleya hyalina]|uniref:Uncharacterized protein n=1 Tax=Embleya hyalina TaxID=516124 RepID=A0A401Z2K2_9ACTN|nr:hypothetical protein [Embleya hyalina]GCE01036.1 hypothetical protein EHYA_08775 [Embleya hyalina]